MPGQEVVQTFSQFGWAVGMLALVLLGIGAGLGIFLRSYLKQQDKEFCAREEERKSKEKTIQEQQAFIKDLAQQAMEEMKGGISSNIKIAGALEEITQTLAAMNATYTMHVKDSERRLKQINAGQEEMYEIFEKIEEQTASLHKAVIGG